MRIFGIVLALTLLGGAGAALAQDGEIEPPRCVETRPGHVDCETTVIPGRPQGPRAFYLIERARVRHEGRDLDRDMADEIRRSVRRDPF